MRSEPPQLIHLLLVCDYSLRYLGGAQTALLRQAEAVIRAGGKVTVLAPDSAAVVLPAGVVGVEPPKTRVLPGAQLPLFRRNGSLERLLSDTLHERKITAVMNHSEYGLAATAAVTAKRLGIPVMHTVHTFFWRAPAVVAPLSGILRLLASMLTGLPVHRGRLAARRFDSALRGVTLSCALLADMIISPSAHQAQRLRDAGAKHVSVVSNVTDSTIAAVKPPTESPLRLAWVGRFAPEKRLEVAVEGTLKALAARGENSMQLRIAGGDPNKRMRRKTAKFPAIMWLGRITPAEVDVLLDDSHALLLTSYGFDNQPMSALEAFNRSRPVILVDPALETEFEGSALLTKNPDSEGIANTLITLIDDQSPLVTASRAAVEFSKRTTAEIHVESLLQIISGIKFELGSR